jgi:hypothetical protein
MKNQSVDFLLTLEKRRHKIHSKHARLTHNFDSGAFMLLVDKGKEVVVNRNIVEERQQIINTVKITLSFKDLAFCLEFTSLNEKRYREQFGKLRTKFNSGRKELPLSLEVTPSENHFEYHKFIIQTPFASELHSVISAGIEKFIRKTVAVKRVRRTPESTTKIALEIEIYKKIGDHVSLYRIRRSYLLY